MLTWFFVDFKMVKFDSCLNHRRSLEAGQAATFLQSPRIAAERTL